MAAQVEICIVDNCEEPVRYYHLHVCSACYSGCTRWRGRKIGEKRKNLGRCNRLVSRMEFILEHPRHHAKQKRKKD
jgi:hypothetical protein